MYVKGQYNPLLKNTFQNTYLDLDTMRVLIEYICKVEKNNRDTLLQQALFWVILARSTESNPQSKRYLLEVAKKIIPRISKFESNFFKDESQGDPEFFTQAEVMLSAQHAIFTSRASSRSVSADLVSLDAVNSLSSASSSDVSMSLSAAPNKYTSKSCLYLSVLLGMLDIAKLLLLHGADLDSLEDLHSNSALNLEGFSVLSHIPKAVEARGHGMYRIEEFKFHVTFMLVTAPLVVLRYLIVHLNHVMEAVEHPGDSTYAFNNVQFLLALTLELYSFCLSDSGGMTEQYGNTSFLNKGLLSMVVEHLNPILHNMPVRRGALFDTQEKKNVILDQPNKPLLMDNETYERFCLLGVGSSKKTVQSSDAVAEQASLSR
jgi:hypothetical protein